MDTTTVRVDRETHSRLLEMGQDTDDCIRALLNRGCSATIPLHHNGG